MDTQYQENIRLNNSQDKNWTGAEYEDMPAAYTIWKVIPPFLIVLGTIGNVLIIAVLIRSSMQKGTTGILFCALAASDLIGLYIGLFPQWIRYLSGISHHEKGTFLCKVLPWIKYSVLDYSAWIVVAVTTERVIATCFPLGAKTICTRMFALGYLVSSGLILLCINVHMLYGFEYMEKDNSGYEMFYCIETPVSYMHFFHRVWPWIDVTVYCLLPFTFICLGNCVILFRVKSSYKRSARSRNLSLGSANKSMPLTRRRGNKRVSNMTVTLLLINSAFFVSTFPVSAYMIAENLSVEFFNDEENVEKIEMWWVFVNNFMYLNNTFNVFLYCLSGSKFRRGVFALFRRLRRFSLSTSTESFRSTPSGSPRSPVKDPAERKASTSTL